MYQIVFQGQGLYNLIVGEIKYVIQIGPHDDEVTLYKNATRLCAIYRPLRNGMLTTALYAIIEQLKLNTLEVPVKHISEDLSRLINIQRGLGGHVEVQEYYDEEHDTNPGERIYHPACFSHGHMRLSDNDNRRIFTLAKTFDSIKIRVTVTELNEHYAPSKECHYFFVSKNRDVPYGPLSLINVTALIPDMFPIIS